MGWFPLLSQAEARQFSPPEESTAKWLFCISLRRETKRGGGLPQSLSRRACSHLQAGPHSCGVAAPLRFPQASAPGQARLLVPCGDTRQHIVPTRRGRVVIPSLVLVVSFEHCFTTGNHFFSAPVWGGRLWPPKVRCPGPATLRSLPPAGSSAEVKTPVRQRNVANLS